MFRRLSVILTLIQSVNLFAKGIDKCDPLNAEIFQTWNLVHMTGGPVKLQNYNAVTDLSEGPIFRDSVGRAFLLPRVESLINVGDPRNSPVVKAFETALQSLRSIENGIPWYKKEVSENIRHWAIKEDNPSYRGNDTIENSYGERIFPYNLPDGSRIYLSERVRDTLTARWGRFRPGDM